MKTDFYTKLILTILAVATVYQATGPSRPFPLVFAQASRRLAGSDSAVHVVVDNQVSVSSLDDQLIARHVIIDDVSPKFSLAGVPVTIQSVGPSMLTGIPVKEFSNSSSALGGTQLEYTGGKCNMKSMNEFGSAGWQFVAFIYDPATKASEKNAQYLDLNCEAIFARTKKF